MSEDIRGRREGREFSRKDQDKQNSQLKKKEKKSKRNVEGLWTGKRITIRKVGYPGNGPSVTWTVDVRGVAKLLPHNAQ